MTLRHLPVMWALSSLLLFSACSKEPRKNEASSSTISGFNYSSEGIQEYYVNGARGGGISIGGGYGSACCVTLPDRWSPDLKLTIGWRRSDCGVRGPKNERCPPLPEGFQMGQEPPKWEYKTLKKIVLIEPFETGDTVQVFFLPNDEVKVYVSSLGPGHKEHPAKLGRPHPLDNPNWKGSE